jgi:hypothetical protein
LLATGYPNVERRCLCRSGVANTPVVMLTFHCYRERLKSAGYNIEGRLFAKEVVDNGPRRPGPAIVELPDKNTSAMSLFSPLTPPATVGVR